MKLLTCPHCGHAFNRKAPEVSPIAMSRACPSCGGNFTYGMRWWLFLLLFAPLVLVSSYLWRWMGSWAPVPGLLLVIFLSLKLVKHTDDEAVQPAAGPKAEADER